MIASRNFQVFKHFNYAVQIYNSFFRLLFSAGTAVWRGGFVWARILPWQAHL